MKKTDFISIRAFAKQINTSETSVRRAIREGKITHEFDIDAKKINVSKASQNSWVKQQGIIKAKPGVSKKKALEKKAKANGENIEKIERPEKTPDFLLPLTENTKQKPLIELLDDTDALLNAIEVTSDMPIDEAMKYREVLALAFDKMKLAELHGTLVSKELVERSLFNIGNELKKACFNISKFIRDIQAAPNEVEGINILNEQLTIIFSEFSEKILK